MSLNALSGSHVLVCVWVLPLSALSGFFSGQVDAQIWLRDLHFGRVCDFRRESLSPAYICTGVAFLPRVFLFSPFM